MKGSTKDSRLSVDVKLFTLRPDDFNLPLAKVLMQPILFVKGLLLITNEDVATLLYFALGIIEASLKVCVVVVPIVFVAIFVTFGQ